MTADDYGLVVGINNYKDPTYSPLDGAKQDAEDFAAWLKSPTGGGVPEKNVDPFMRLSDAAASQPMLSHLLILLGEIRKRAALGRKRIGRRLYIFLAGHGISPLEMDEAGLLTVEAEEMIIPYLPGKQSADQFGLTARFEEIVLFMDCCRVTDVLVTKFTVPTSEKADPAAAGKVKRFYAFATALGKTAREMDHGGVIRGIFSRVLLDGLKGGAPADPQGRVTTTQLRMYLESELRKVELNGEEQVPHFPVSDEIVLLEGQPRRRVTVNLDYAQPVSGLSILDGGNNLASVTPEELTPTPSGHRFLLAAGKTYAIFALDAAGNRTRMIQLKVEGDNVRATL